MSDLGLELIFAGPRGGHLAQDYLAGAAPAEAFYGGSFRDPQRRRALAGRIGSRLDRERAARLLAGTAPGEAARVRLEEFVRKQGFIVTTGQQPVLFGGPLYVLYKAATALALARRLEAELGVPVLAVFWNAGDDHDFEEVSSVGLAGPRGELQRLRLPREDRLPRPVCRVFPGPGLEALFTELEELTAGAPWGGWLLDRLRDSYREGLSLAGAFGEFLAGLLAERGLFVVDSCAPELRRECRELFRAELLDSRRTFLTLDHACRELVAAGYELQVTPLERDTNLFLVGADGAREKIVQAPQGEGFVLKHSGRKIGRAELEDRLEREPEAFSPGVLLRPLVEAELFGTLAYAAGPGEIAYYGQLAGLYRLREIEMPLIWPRLAGTLVDRRTRRVLDRYGLRVEDLARGAQALADQLLAGRGAPGRVLERTAELRRLVEERLAEVGTLAEGLDPTLAGPVRGTVIAIGRRLERLERKTLRAARDHHRIMLDRLRRAEGFLRPQGSPQERVLGGIGLLARYGPEFIDFVLDQATRRVGELLDGC